MVSAKDELKVRAELLHRKLQAGDVQATARLNRVPSLRKAAPQDLPQLVRHKHCLACVAREFGFEDWQHAARVLDGENDQRGFGKLLWNPSLGGFINHWFRDHAEADAQRRASGGYLLPYKQDYSVVTSAYVAALGLDPEDPDWALMDWDWAKPSEPAARTRMYAKLLATHPRELAPDSGAS